MQSIHHTLRAAALAAAGLFIGLGAQAQAVVTTTFQPITGWQQVAQNTTTSLGAFAPGSGWDSLYPLSLGDRLNNQFLLIDGGESATFTFTGLTIGNTYDVNLSFAFAGFRDHATNLNALRINTDFGTNAARTVAENLPAGCADDNACAGTFGAGLTAVAWNGIPQFVASANTGTFTFNALGNGQSRIALDNVRVTVNDVTPVPEPETYAMMLAGLGAIGFMSRRRKARQA